jgi:hypothetical protein
MKIRDVFQTVAIKKLAAVDLPHLGSNQHEINGVAALREFFGTSEKVTESVSWHYFTDDKDPVHSEGFVTFYDSRAANPLRTEWRLYYTGDALKSAAPEDMLVLARTSDGRLHGLVFAEDSGWLGAAKHLFGPLDSQNSFTMLSTEAAEQNLEYLRQQILDELGISYEFAPAPNIEVAAEKELRAARRDGTAFPSTLRMSLAAKELAQADKPDPDTLLMAWLNAEEDLFRALERIIVYERLGHGFSTVDEFVSYSLSVHNRRKSRRGTSLELHLREMFVRAGLRFDEQFKTERGHKPDFLFPGAAEYQDPNFDPQLLTMVAAKTTCKDRWPQVLPEADRIWPKHLLTLDTKLTGDTLERMSQDRVVAVLPTAVQETYPHSLRESMLDCATLLDLLKRRQPPQEKSR